MSEFEKEVVSRLASIETKAENYITWKHVLMGLGAFVVAIGAYGELMLTRMDSKFDDALSEAATAFEETIAERQAEIIAAVTFSGQGLGGNLPYMAIDATGGKFSVYQPSVAQDLKESWSELSLQAVAGADFRSVEFSKLFIEQEDGTFVLAFPEFTDIKK